MDNVRIISLLPGATETIAALGLTDKLVGRSHECDYPESVQSLPVCTAPRLNSAQRSAAIDTDVRELLKSALSLYEVQTEVLASLQPTHIITQDQCDVCAVTLPMVEASLASITGTKPQIVSLRGETLVGVWEDIRRVATALKIDPEPAIAQLQARVRACTERTQTLAPENRPTVAAIEWIEPLMGAGNWIPELIEMAGSKSCFGTAGVHSPYLEWEALVAADPDAIVVMPCGFDLDRTRQEMPALCRRPGWENLRAVKSDRVYLTDGNAYFNRPGPRLVDSLEILTQILHPLLFAPEHRSLGWESFSALATA